MIEREAVGPAGDLAGGLAPDENPLSVPGDRPPLELDADETPRGMRGIEPGQRLAPDELPLLELDGPPQRAAEGVGPVVHVLPVEAQAGLEPERVACPAPAGNQALRRARLEEGIPQARRVGRVDVEFEAVLPRIPGARHRRSDPGHPAVPA